MIMEKETTQTQSTHSLPAWMRIAAPLLALGLLVLVFTLTNPTGAVYRKRAAGGNFIVRADPRGKRRL